MNEVWKYCKQEGVSNLWLCISACDDGCTGVLLNELALLDKQLQEGAGHLIGGVIPPPWPQLQETNKTAFELKNWLNLAERVAMLPDDISDKLKWQAQQLLDKVSM
jgi:hypothetical protein